MTLGPFEGRIVHRVLKVVMDRFPGLFRVQAEAKLRAMDCEEVFHVCGNAMKGWREAEFDETDCGVVEGVQLIEVLGALRTKHGEAAGDDFVEV